MLEHDDSYTKMYFFIVTELKIQYALMIFANVVKFYMELALHFPQTHKQM